MIYNMRDKKFSFLEKISEEQKIIFIYRYASLFITSMFYFFTPTNHTVDRKLLVIVCILVSSVILNYIYIKKNNNISVIELLVFLETIGNSLILIPSGGLNSPYIWYALNTIFIAAVMLDRKYCWINLMTYLISSTWVSYTIFDAPHYKFSEVIKHQTSLMVSFILVTMANWLLLKYINDIKLERIKLLRVNKQLRTANQQVKESVNHIMELYQAVQLFSNLRNKNELIELILEYTKRIINTNVIIFFDNESEEIISSASNGSETEIPQELKRIISGMWDSIVNNYAATPVTVGDEHFLVIGVKSSYMTYGVLGVKAEPKGEGINHFERMDQLKFLADLSSIVLEKFELEKVNNKLIITEERNRIANEIHDSVLQRLFSTSFGIYGLVKRLNKANINDVDEDLYLIRESIDQAMKELRSAIYGLSWKKNGSDSFIAELMRYIDEIKRMNNVDINLNIIGESGMIVSMSKKAIYRIMCEGISNALRHGKANHIEVTLNIKEDVILLRIVDDGEGFDYDSVCKNRQGGLGISNMHFLVGSLKGKINYESKIGKGTIIHIMIPNQTNGITEDLVI